MILVTTAVAIPMSVGQMFSPIIALIKDDLPRLNSPQNNMDVALSILSIDLLTSLTTACFPYS